MDERRFKLLRRSIRLLYILAESFCTRCENCRLTSVTVAARQTEIDGERKSVEVEVARRYRDLCAKSSTR